MKTPSNWAPYIFWFITKLPSHTKSPPKQNSSLSWTTNKLQGTVDYYLVVSWQCWETVNEFTQQGKPLSTAPCTSELGNDRLSTRWISAKFSPAPSECFTVLVSRVVLVPSDLPALQLKIRYWYNRCLHASHRRYDQQVIPFYVVIDTLWSTELYSFGNRSTLYCI